MRRIRLILGVGLVAIGIVLGGYFLLTSFSPDAAVPNETPPAVTEPVESTPAVSVPVEPTPALPTPTASDELPDEPPALTDAPAPDEEPPEMQVGELPTGKLVVTKERKSYRDGNLTLFIPVISVTRKIYNGTDRDTLNKGVGLYEYAQLPGEGNRNVSMAGHRNGLSNGVVTDRAPFFYIDTLQEGDYLYIYDSEFIYRYVWEYCEIVEPDDWGPIRTAGYSCLTITSCHPIGISDHRIVVRGVLDEILPYDRDYAFPATVEEVLP